MARLDDTVECPRCGQEAQELHVLPDAVLEGTSNEGTTNAEPDADVRYGRACEWCRHEIFEG